jgi:segregation and condensation protein A
MQEQIYDLLVKESEVTWQDIIYNLVKSEQMNPWDVDISQLTRKYIHTVTQMSEMNYQLSGKILLASAILLKMKSKKLIEDDINNFDSFLFHTPDEDLLEELDDFLPYHEHKVEIPKLGVKTPQTRKRKVSVTDLISALEKALKVDTRRKLRLQRYLVINKPKIPEKKIDITDLIDKLHLRLTDLFKSNPKRNFSEIIPGNKAQDKILTLLPLLFLYNQKKIDMIQFEQFGEIEISSYRQIN